LPIDPEIADDLINSFDEHYDGLQYSLNKLSHNPEDMVLINVIFRDIHTIKGNAAMMQLQPLVDFTHAMEETIDSIRSGNFLPTEKICDLLLTGMDQLRDLHKHYLFDKPYDSIDEKVFAASFIDISTSQSVAEAEVKAAKLYQLLYPEEAEPAVSSEPTSTVGDFSAHHTYLQGDDSQFKDLKLFRTLALQVDKQNHFWTGRTDHLVYLALKLCNLSSDVTVDKTQLIAAIYMHDIGMAFLPFDLVNKQAKLNAMELKNVQFHVDWAYNILVRMPTWQDAATMVLQHHEQEDGAGYPSPDNLTSEDLCEGAKIVAILDAFYAMTNLRSDRTHRRSVLRAISEVNACAGTQFNEYWVTLFNQLVKNELKDGKL
jgi:two-component system response regulator RpfG